MDLHTYLSVVLNSDKFRPCSIAEFSKYEAMLYKGYFYARMAYLPGDYFCKMLKYQDHSAVDVNSALARLHQFKKRTFAELMTSRLQDCNLTKRGYIGSYAQNPLGFESVYTVYQHTPRSRINPDPTVYIAFKGTSTMTEMLKTDILKVFNPRALRVLPFCRGLPGIIHGGFADALLSVIDPTLKALRELLDLHNNTKRIIVCGHSLGAAMATLCGMVLCNAMKDGALVTRPVHVMTYGCPKVFSDDARLEFNKLLLLRMMTLDTVSHDSDLITHVPRSLNSPGFVRSKLSNFKRSSQPEKVSEWRQLFTGNSDAFIGDVRSSILRRKKKNTTNLHHSHRILFTDRPTKELMITTLRTKKGVTRRKSIERAITGGSIGLYRTTRFYKSERKRRLPTHIVYGCWIPGIDICHGEYMGITGTNASYAFGTTNVDSVKVNGIYNLYECSDDRIVSVVAD